MSQRIGIFGGAFDPVHVGHLRLAIEVREALGLDRIHFVPTGRPVHRGAPGASGVARQHMLERALATLPELVVDPTELVREGPSFMVDTLAAFRAREPDGRLCLLLGMDQFATLDTWYRWETLLTLTHLAVVRRPGVEFPCEGGLATLLEEQVSNDPNHLDQGCDAQRRGRIFLVDAPVLDISSTHIRALVAAGRNPRFLVPDEVRDYIENEDLYTHAK